MMKMLGDCRKKEKKDVSAPNMQNNSILGVEGDMSVYCLMFQALVT